MLSFHVLKLTQTNITVLPLTQESFRDVRDQVVAVQILSAAGKFGMGLKKLSPDELQFAVEVMEVCMGNELIRTSHRQELTALPQTLIIICKTVKIMQNHHTKQKEEMRSNFYSFIYIYIYN